MYDSEYFKKLYIKLIEKCYLEPEVAEIIIVQVIKELFSDEKVKQDSS